MSKQNRREIPKRDTFRSAERSSPGKSFGDLPRPPIADVLRDLGAPDVPTGFGWVRMHCPFHEDRTKSASVNHEIGGFACHSCSRRGDGLKLLQTELGLDFREACERASVLDPEYGNRQSKRPKRRPSDLLKGA